MQGVWNGRMKQNGGTRSRRARREKESDQYTRFASGCAVLAMEPMSPVAAGLMSTIGPKRLLLLMAKAAAMRLNLGFSLEKGGSRVDARRGGSV